VQLNRSSLFVALVILVPWLALTQTAVTPVNSAPNPYQLVENWAKLPEGRTWGSTSAVDVDLDGKSIWVAERCGANTCVNSPNVDVVLKFDESGKLVKSFGAGLMVFPHGIHVDREGNIWVTDGQDNLPRAARGAAAATTPATAPAKVIGHQVFKFNPDGKVIMTLGKAGVSGSGPDLFDQPTDVVVAPNGDIFVTDSHRTTDGPPPLNNRVVKFTKEGTFVKAWGTKGSGPGELSEPHAIAMDSRGRLFVGDRENNRIQIFDQDGKYLDEWRQFGRPSGIFITADDTIYVADSESGPDTGAHELMGIKKGIRIGSARDGRVTAFVEDMESTRADHSGAEGVGVDAQGNVYGGVVRRQMLERHVRK